MSRNGTCVCRGIAASAGVVVGPALVVRRSRLAIPRRKLPDDQLDDEVRRLRVALERSRQSIAEAQESLADSSFADHRLILEAHLMMHRDELLVDATIDAIVRERRNAEWALSRTADRLREQLLASDTAYFRERAQDVEHVADHILRLLVGAHTDVPTLNQPSVLITDDLSPADAARLVDAGVLAIVTGLGTASSHTAILARALEIPAVVGVENATRMFRDGETLIVDGLRGEVVGSADQSTLENARQRAVRYRQFTSRLRDQHRTGAATTDGVSIRVLANIELPTEVSLAAKSGAEGVGLYRTEFLYLDRSTPPTEEEQFDVYSDVVRAMQGRPITIRTYDLGGDKLPLSDRTSRSPNPALGLRALRLSLSRPDLLRAQLRAVLRASAFGPVRLMFPLVSTRAEIRMAREHVEAARSELESEGVSCGHVPLGIMVEVPSAALMAEAFAAECDFFSVGTNDLIQYTLAIDRLNPQVAHLGRALDPAVIRLLDLTSRAAASEEISCAMCGDMASDPLALPIVLGLGFRDLSMPYSAIALAREIISRVDSRVARETADEALSLSEVEEVTALVVRRFGETLGDLWEEQGLSLGAGLAEPTTP